MTNNDLIIQGNHVTYYGVDFAVDYPVRDFLITDDLLLILYEYTCGPKHKQFQNLQAFNKHRRKIWIAEHPTNTTADIYVDFQKDKPLTVLNLAGYKCEIELATGKLLNATMTM